MHSRNMYSETSQDSHLLTNDNQHVVYKQCICISNYHTKMYTLSVSVHYRVDQTVYALVLHYLNYVIVLIVQVTV